MKRSVLLGLALSLTATTGVGAQGLTMQMSNGWSLTFSGNVNAFLTFTDPTCDAAAGCATLGDLGGLVPTGEQESVSRIRTGLLPTFATFDAKGREGNVDLGVHFGFAPEIQTPNREHDNFGNGTQAGTQIDMRQVFLTVGGSWGQILAGREIGLFLRQNILTDMTLYGVGSTGGGASGAGTTLGRIGLGYVYPNFNSQMTYSSPANRPIQVSIGVFDPSTIAQYAITKTPRVEAELTWTSTFGAQAEQTAQQPSANMLMVWVNGMYQHVGLETGTCPGCTEGNLDADGVGGGVKLGIAGLSLVGSGYWGQGIGTTLMFNDLATDAGGETRDSYGFIGQAEFQPSGSRWRLGASYGESDVQQTDADEATGTDFIKKNWSIVGALTFQWTRSLRWVWEYTYTRSELHSGTKAHSNQGAAGLMLFF